MEYFWHWHGDKVLLGILVAFIAFFIILFSKSESRLMNQCMADGRKEYECTAMLRQNVIVLPAGR